ncbi:hypothetical protein AQ930_05450 [Burkholderia pseudomallei]|nr:hypothetical protein AQ928_03515 [Burkholderia pseudomallei]OND15650.1 hypothetical protein AQ927_01065 [Burkholderia pseudomallei]OND17043.1 hypothetical protein AQ929_29315 [Burkholderia pseudomallei]OND25449.1 hypothetical protein AQ930_05450 [Burkholderia pseudomallei]
MNSYNGDLNFPTGHKQKHPAHHHGSSPFRSNGCGFLTYSNGCLARRRIDNALPDTIEDDDTNFSASNIRCDALEEWRG